MLSALPVAACPGGAAAGAPPTEMSFASEAEECLASTGSEVRVVESEAAAALAVGVWGAAERGDAATGEAAASGQVEGRSSPGGASVDMAPAMRGPT